MRTILILFTAAIYDALAQQPRTTDLTVDIANVVEYRADVSDVTKFARLPTITPAVPVGTGPTDIVNFSTNTGIGDIVAVNGEPAKGLFASRSRAIGASASSLPGRAIADVPRTSIREDIFEIQKPDGTPIGTIITLGFSGGPSPPGQPSGEVGNWAIVGGTGAFLGARGQAEGAGNTPRAASMAEDPSFRRTNGGGPGRYYLHVIPLSTPQVLSTQQSPAVAHSTDFSLVTASNPATAGELLSLFATGLGPTVPALAPGRTFTSEPLAQVNSPVRILINGRPADVLAAVGFPGTANTYQVNFRMPSEVSKGTALVEISAAWVAAPGFEVPVR